MKFKEIKFLDENASRIYRGYLKRIQNTTKVLDKSSQQEILLEINSHIYEAVHKEKQTNKNEIDELLNVLEKLGHPEAFLKPLIAEKKLEEATRTFHPVKVFKALILNFSNGFSYVLFFMLYLFLFAFIALIVMKICMPSQVGFFYSPDKVFVIGMTTAKYEGYEILGGWFIPLMLLSTVISYLLITLLLKFKLIINKKL